MTTLARPGAWPLTAGHGIPTDTPIGHLANALQALRHDQQLNDWPALPDHARVLLAGVLHRVELAYQGLQLLQADHEGGLHLADGCSCVVDRAGRVVVPCATHDSDDTGRRND